MKTIDIALLDSVTGGVFSPCGADGELAKVSLLKATPKQIALAKSQCGLKLPSQKLIEEEGRIRF